MSRILPFFLALFLLNSAAAQKRRLPLPPPEPPTQEQMRQENENHTCSNTNKYSQKERRQFYPFSEADTVKIVSFDNRPDANGIIEIGGNRLPMKNGKIDFTKLDETKQLNEAQIDTLTDILYNIGNRGEISVITESGCYNPRNAIVFVNKKGKSFAFLELCFECEGKRASSKKVKTGDFCNEKYDLLKAFFARAGIEIGITKGIGMHQD